MKKILPVRYVAPCVFAFFLFSNQSVFAKKFTRDPFLDFFDQIELEFASQSPIKKAPIHNIKSLFPELFPTKKAVFFHRRNRQNRSLNKNSHKQYHTFEKGITLHGGIASHEREKITILDINGKRFSIRELPNGQEIITTPDGEKRIISSEKDVQNIMREFLEKEEQTHQRQLNREKSNNKPFFDTEEELHEEGQPAAPSMEDSYIPPHENFRGIFPPSMNGHQSFHDGAFPQNEEKPVWEKYDPAKVKDKIYLNDVIGQVEAKKKVNMAITFMQNPILFEKVGAKMPRGILFYGPPGTGKTLLAKAIASETKVPMFIVSGSAFVEIFVGKGAKRVRDLFAELKRYKKVILFIDEADAVFPKRSSSSENNREDERTLTQFLTLLDGFFNDSKNCLVFAATNRKDKIDEAILRPGRLNYHIEFNNPTLEDKEKLLKLYTKKIACDDEIDNPFVKNLAKSATTRATTNKKVSHADMAEIVNRAAIISAMEANKNNKNNPLVTKKHFEEACSEVIQGNLSHNKKTEQDNIRISYHELGHAIVIHELYKEKKTQREYPIDQITIIARGNAGGMTKLKDTDEYFAHYTKNDIEESISFLYGGYLAEKVFCKDVSLGAMDDFKKAGEQAEILVKKGFGNRTEGKPFKENMSDDTKKLYEQDEKEILEKCKKRAEKIILAKKDSIEKIKNILMDKEKISGDEFYKLLES